MSNPTWKSVRDESAVELRVCPLCNGPLVPLEGLRRCVRCQFSYCEGCEGGPAPRAWPEESATDD